MKVQQTLLHVFNFAKQIPLQYALGGAFLVVIVGYFALFGIEKSVSFSYMGATCVRHAVLFPSLHKIEGQPGFSVYSTDELRIGNFPIGAGTLCFQPTNVPETGATKVRISLFGGILAKKTFALQVPPPVEANVAAFEKPVSVSRPLTVDLSNGDTTFVYKLRVNDREADCAAEQRQLKCDIQSLGLDQGKPYAVTLSRLFQGQEVGTVVRKDIMTLSATQVKESSVKSGETVFAKPKVVSFILDKKITHVQAKLYRVEGDKKAEVESTTAITDTGLAVNFKDDLPRSADYEVVVESVEAEDGSGLEDPYILPFKMSGGPKVTGVNVGRTGVPVGVTVVVTFDQPLLEGQDTSKSATFGGGASFAGKKGNQVFVSLSGVPKCGDFTITFNNDIKSNYEIGGNSAWSFTGRTLCYTVGAIGYSSKGRPINAYYFGNGSRTILYTGAIHGNESGTKALMDRWVQELEANARSIPSDKSVVVVPQINPDGIASGSRTNGRNVDINRNFATNDWKKDITDVNNRPFPGGGGDAAMSEPETRAIAGLASRLRPAVILSYHSIGGVVAANQAGNSGTLAAKYAQLSGYGDTTGQTSETFEYSVSGTADDWYAEKLGVASILIELSSHTSAQFERNQKAMWAMVNL